MSIVQVPWRRRLQTLSLLHYVLVWLLVPFVCLWVPVYVLMFTQYWWWVGICVFLMRSEFSAFREIFVERNYIFIYFRSVCLYIVWFVSIKCVRSY
jgi:hypothetical protein